MDDLMEDLRAAEPQIRTLYFSFKATSADFCCDDISMYLLTLSEGYLRNLGEAGLC